MRNQLSAYADGELSLAEARSVEEHLLQCEVCSREHASLQQLVWITSSIPAEDVPTGLHAAILNRLSYAETARPRPVRRAGMGLFSFNPWVWTAASGAAAALVMGLLQRPECEVPKSPQSSALGKVRTSPRPAEPDTRRVERQLTARPAPPAPHVEKPEQPAASNNAVAAACEAVTPVVVPDPAPRRVRVSQRSPQAAPLRAAPTEPAPVGEAPVPDPAVTPAPASGIPGMMAAMPGEPMVNSVNTAPAPDALVLGMEKEPVTRMAGAPTESEIMADDEEGVRSLRMFLEERNRTVPQPPSANPLGTRPVRKL